jgi:pimeloyl-ACP methyl ester carboxylesterase
MTINPRTAAVACLSPVGFHTVRWVEWGEAQNPDVVVCVHGLTRQGRDFDRLAARLASRYRVVCPDIVGRGRSDWLRDFRHYQYPQYVQDMATLLAAVAAQRLFWVGTSMGGIIGMALAAMPGTPVRKLVLNDVGARIPKVALERIGAYVGRDPTFASFESYLAFMKQLSPFGPMSEADWEHFARHQIKVAADGQLQSHYDPGIGEAYRLATAGQPIEDVDLSSYWTRVECPTLVIRGEHSDLLTAEGYAAMTARANVVGYLARDCGHAPSLTRAMEIDVIEQFLQGE